MDSLTPEWKREYKCLDITALLLDAQGYTSTIQAQARSRGDWGAVEEQGEALERCLEMLLIEARSYWPALYAAAKGER